MSPSLSLRLPLVALLVGMGLGWIVARGSLESKRPQASEPPNSGQFESTDHDRTREARARARDFTKSRHRDPAISGMAAPELLQRLLFLNGHLDDPRRSPQEMHEAISQMHELVREMRLEEVEELLSSMIEREQRDPWGWLIAPGLAEMLLERLVDADLGAAVAWARANDKLSAIAGILSRRDPMAAASFIRSEGVATEGNSIAALNIGRFAAELGPVELLALEEVLGERGISRALEFIPPGQCESFADAWYAGLKSGEKSPHDLGRILERWAEFAPQEMVSWYRSRPGLGEEIQFVYGLMSALLGSREDVGLDFAEAEFRRSPKMSRMLFTFAVNSRHEPELWLKLAERLPADSKPGIDHFSEHLRPGFAPGPEGIVAAAWCIESAEERYHYLKRALPNSSAWANDTGDFSQNAVQSARGKLESLPLEAAQLTEILDLYDQVAAAAASRASEKSQR
jgi:hypothetical protein